MKFGFSVLLIFTFSFCRAELILKNGPAQKVHCNLLKRLPQSYISYKGFATGWKHDHIYPVRVCAVFKGNVKSCENSKLSQLNLNIVIYDHDNGIMWPVRLDIPSDSLIASKTFCYTFSAEYLANKFRYNNIIGSKIGASAALYADQESESDPTIAVTIGAVPYEISEPTLNFLAVPTFGHVVHAITCNFENCVVVAEGTHRAIKKTEQFIIVEGKTPQFVKGDAPLGAKMFSVTSFECAKKCPTMFSAIKAPRPSTAATPTDAAEEVKTPTKALSPSTTITSTTTTTTSTATNTTTTTNTTTNTTTTTTTSTTSDSGFHPAATAGVLLGVSLLLVFPALVAAALYFTRHLHFPLSAISLLSFQAERDFSTPTSADESGCTIESAKSTWQ